MAKTHWIIAKHDSSMDHTVIYTLFGTKSDVKKYIAADIKKVRKLSCKEDWEGEEGITEYGDGTIYNCAMFYDYKLYYDAYPVNAIPVIN